MSGGSYEITIVGDDELSGGHDFAMIVLPDGVMAVYRDSSLCPLVLEQSQAALFALLGESAAVDFNPTLRNAV